MTHIDTQTPNLFADSVCISTIYSNVYGFVRTIDKPRSIGYHELDISRYAYSSSYPLRTANESNCTKVSLEFSSNSYSQPACSNSSVERTNEPIWPPYSGKMRRGSCGNS